MRQWYYLFFFWLIIASCKSNKTNSGIIPMLKMEMILTDLMKADQFISDFRVPHDTAMDRDTESIKMYQKIFALHDINKEQFEKSLVYYQSRPDLLKIIMDSISKPTVIVPEEPTPMKDTANLKKVRKFSTGDSSIPLTDSPFIKKKTLLKNN